MMRSLFYEKELVQTKYSILNFIKGQNSKDLLEEDSTSDLQTEESVSFD